ncbi:unnamed protein product [Ilex paraguariensis]|uniref:Uncharacterized protein n=1 Tax=Ilex paraguariensis TaxID=185542 RepID=A0ABC8SIA9_9AQUA
MDKFFENQWMVLMAEMLKLHFHAMGDCTQKKASKREGGDGPVLKGKVPNETSNKRENYIPWFCHLT